MKQLGYIIDADNQSLKLIEYVILDIFIHYLNISHGKKEGKSFE